MEGLRVTISVFGASPISIINICNTITLHYTFVENSLLLKVEIYVLVLEQAELYSFWCVCVRMLARGTKARY